MKKKSSSGNGNFKLSKNDEVICELAYMHWFLEKAKNDIERKQHRNQT